jgi:hypothetical protein
VADARNNINDLISEMEHKKTMNADAASRVKYSNQDLLAFINEYSGSPSARPMTPTNMKYSPPNAPHHNRTNMLNHQMHNEEA